MNSNIIYGKGEGHTFSKIHENKKWKEKEQIHNLRDHDLTKKLSPIFTKLTDEYQVNVASQK